MQSGSVVGLQREDRIDEQTSAVVRQHTAPRKRMNAAHNGAHGTSTFGTDRRRKSTPAYAILSVSTTREAPLAHGGCQAAVATQAYTQGSQRICWPKSPSLSVAFDTID